MSVVEKFAAFVGSLSPEETGAVMPMMISFMQSNLGAGMTGPNNAGPDAALPPPPPGADAGPGAPPPPACHLGQNPRRRRRCPACSRAG